MTQQRENRPLVGAGSPVDHQDAPADQFQKRRSQFIPARRFGPGGHIAVADADDALPQGFRALTEQSDSATMRCRECGRELTAPKSTQAGVGWRCAAKGAV